MRTLRKVILGETWALPIGIAAAVGVAAALDAMAGSEAWWTDAGGFVLLVLLVFAFAAGLGLRR